MEEEIDEIYDEIDEMAEDLYDGDWEEDDGEDLDDEDLYEVVCPTCGEEIYVDEGTLSEGAMECPACGEDLEFDMSELDEEDGVYNLCVRTVKFRGKVGIYIAGKHRLCYDIK